VNLDGGLVGINTAIASPTGAYSGYGFAIPSNIVNKVVEDLIKYGMVQRGVLGVMIRSVDGNLAKEKELNVTAGVYVDSLMENSAAASVGIKTGDIIIGVDDAKIKSSPELLELIAQHRPGDKVDIKVNRNGAEKSFLVTLNNQEGSTSIVSKEEQSISSALGADFENLDEQTAQKLNLTGGVRVKNIRAGKLRHQTQMKEGFIITKVNGQTIHTTKDLDNRLKNKKGGVMLEGVYEDIPGVYYYAFGLES
jgi:S1-C subfamily serine protease